MNRKTYGVETVLHKKRNRPFANEVVKQIEAGEDLFSALCASKIKEIKHKAKNEDNKKKKKKKKAREFTPLQVLRECSSTENLMDSFDALMIAPRNNVESAHLQCSKSHLFERMTNIPIKNKNFRNKDEIDEENFKKSSETLQDNCLSLACSTNKENEILSSHEKESKIFSKNCCKSGKLSCKTSKKSVPNLYDSDLAFLEDSEDLESFTEDFMAGKINIRGLKTEEPSSIRKRAKILLPKTSNEVLGDCMITEVEKKKTIKNKIKKDGSLENAVNSSDEFLSVLRGRIKRNFNLVNSTPTSCRHTEPDCVLSPILPVLPQCSISDGECTEKAENCLDKLALVSESFLPVRRVEDFDSEQNGKETLVRNSLIPYNVVYEDRMRTKSASCVGKQIISYHCRMESPDPFADSGDKRVLNNFGSSSSMAEQDSVNGCSPASRKASLTKKESVNVLGIDSQRRSNSVELKQNQSVLVPLERSLEGSEEITYKSEANVSHKLQFSRRPGHELEGSDLLERSMRKLALSFSRRSSHVVLPLVAQCDLQKITGFREVYTSSFVMRSTLLNCNAVEESCSGEKRNEEITFKDVVLELCEQTEILQFLDVFSDCDFAESTKIGEGVYGEVFSRTNSDGVSSVMKIMPIEGTCTLNGEPQKKYEEILPEVVITRELSNLRANEIFGTLSFPELIKCWCVQGTYPSKLLKLWHQFHEEKGSENDSPEILPEDQIYIILELSNVGTAMEGFTFSSASQALSVFMQVAYALASAEAALEFEHRDLHWGNILIKKTKRRSLPLKLYGEDHRIPTSGVQATVIDFTLSRITYDGCCIYNNLADDPALFEGKDDYQFDIYRFMRNETGNNWEVFKPYNNVLWLSYVLEKLISGVRYPKKPGKGHNKGLDKLKELRKKITDFESAMDVALSFMNKR